MSLRFLAPAVLLSGSLLLAHAHAQRGREPSPAAQVERTLTCARAPHAELAATMRLLEEAKTTLVRTTASEAERQRARQAITALEARMRTAAAAVAACAVLSSERTPERTLAGRSLLPHRRISSHVHAGYPQVSRGHGRIDPRSVLEGLRIGRDRFEACHVALAARTTRTRGAARLVFTITERPGPIRDLTITDSTIDDPEFAACLTRAVATLQLTARVIGSIRVYVPLFFSDP